MSDKTPSKKMGRPVMHQGKSLERTFLLSDASDELITEVAEELGCSRSDALEDILISARTTRKRVR